jgi:hypothetical protein
VLRDVILEVLDAGWSYSTVTIKDGRPFFATHARQICRRRGCWRFQTATSTVNSTPAWIELQGLNEPK